MNQKAKTNAKSRTVRCAIYTRKSTEEGLEQEFNSLDAQRESGEAYIKSQAAEGWVCLPEHYDDGGFTGGNMERPALKRLLLDIEAGKVDCVIVYKVDRLSRSLLDFARMMAIFEQHNVSFVSVTQLFHTATSMGRLVLNVLLSFAQFEREIISERTRDKIAAARRKGKWAGGHPLLGYDIDPHNSKLVVNEEEAAQVRTIFELYLRHEGLIPVVQELERRGWRTKRWRTRKGRERGGRRFTKTNLHKLLTNITYIGKVRYKQEVHEGEQVGIVDPDVFQRVQALLHSQRRADRAMVGQRFGALLQGLLRCVPCQSAMTPSHTTRHGTKRYRYYTCVSAQKQGWKTCPSKSLSAGEIERLVVHQVRALAKDSSIRSQLLNAAHTKIQEQLQELEAERLDLEQDLGRGQREIQKLALGAMSSERAAAVQTQLADLQERVRTTKQRLSDLHDGMASLRQQLLPESVIAQTMADLDSRWEFLTGHEQCRILHLLVERVDYDGASGKAAITFRPEGLLLLVQELANRYLEEHV